MMSDYAYAVNIYCEVFLVESDDGDVHMKGTQEALKTLTQQEQAVLEYYYRQRMTLKQTGKAIGGVTGSRANQIRHKALRKLRHPSRSNKISVSNFAKAQEAIFSDMAEALKKQRSQIEKLDKQIYELMKGNPISPEVEADMESRQERIQNRGLPDGVVAKLLRANIRTVEKLLSFETVEPIMKVRSIGGKTLDRLISEMRERGYVEWADKMQKSIKA